MKPWLLISVLLWPSLGMACNVPVFRYALERWRASSYEVVVFYAGSFTEDEREMVDGLQEAGDTGKGLVNFSITTINVSLSGDEANARLWAGQTNAALPWTIVRAPRREPTTPPVWAGPLSKQTSQRLMASPARDEISRRLLNGDSAVWLLVESGDSGSDQAAFRMLETELRAAEKSLELPVPDPSDPRMRADLPLRIAFSIQRLARNDPAEAFLFAVLEHYEPWLATNRLAAAIPVFGRGRVLAALAGDRFTPSVVRDACAFITGACSCQVKEQNPGFDLLMAADWDALVDHRLVQESESPPLMGFSQGMAPPGQPGAPPMALTKPSVPLGGAQGSGGLKRNLLVVLALVLAVVATGTLVLRSKLRNQLP